MIDVRRPSSLGRTWEPIKRERRSKRGEITNWGVIEDQVIYFRTHMDMFIEQAFAPVKLTPVQHVIARGVGNATTSAVVAPRGYGKTWLTAFIAVSLAALYPGTSILVVAPTADQATRIAEKIRDLCVENENFRNEIKPTNAKTYVSISKEESTVTLKNGSVIRSIPINRARSYRAKMVIVDEARDVDMNVLRAVVKPTRNETRYNPRTFGYEDFDSKIIYITSACPKSYEFYKEFERIVQARAAGDKSYFACVLNKKTPIAEGLTKKSFYEEERAGNPEAIFQMEYESKFIGANANSALPYDLTNTCRTLKQVELFQPKNTKSRYAIGLDIATSAAKGSDNTVMVVEKWTERQDGSFAKKIVFIKSYNGEPLDFLAEELRKLYHQRFPSAEKIIFDARGVGNSFSRFFDKEWLDPITGKEYPPLAVDNEPLANPDAIPILRPFNAVNSSQDPNKPTNVRIYSHLRMALEQKTIELPIAKRIVRAEQEKIEDESKRMPKDEMAIYDEADQMQIEMGNIVAKHSSAGNDIYDVPKANQHKDRYSALAMVNDYVCELEKVSIRNTRHGEPCIGITSALDDSRYNKMLRIFY